MTETPKEAAKRLAAPALRDGFVPEALHTYRDQERREIFWRIRAKHSDGRKWIRPMKLNGHGYEIGEPAFPTGKKPLYRLDEIASNPNAAVWIVEGEKAADALAKHGIVASTSGGAESADKADWEPLRGRQCIVWPDFDEAGKGYAGAVAAILQSLGCEFKGIDVDRLGLPPKGDAFDWLQTHPEASQSDLDALPMLAPSESVQNATAGDLARRGFRSVTMLELANLELPAREPLLQPWLFKQGLAQVHAWRGIGKTHFSIGTGYAVSTGGKFLRWDAPKPQRVLFLDGEMPAVALKERLAAIIEADARDIDVDAEMLRFVTPDLLDGAPPDLADQGDQDALQRLIEDFSPALIIVDNISTLVRSGGAENDAEAWIPVQTWALRQRRDGRAVLFVHHTGKGGKQRGTSKREDVLDAVIALRCPDPYDPADGARFIVEFEKARYLHGDDTKAFEAHLGKDAHGRQVWSVRDLEECTLERVVRAAKDGLKMREIAEELGVNKSTVSRALKKAREDGWLPKENKARDPGELSEETF